MISSVVQFGFRTVPGQHTEMARMSIRTRVYVAIVANFELAVGVPGVEHLLLHTLLQELGNQVHEINKVYERLLLKVARGDCPTVAVRPEQERVLDAGPRMYGRS